MHDIDRTLMEYTPESVNFEEEQFDFTQGAQSGETSEVFSETDLLELATDLLEVTNDEELDFFLGNLIRKASGALKKAVSSPVGQALGGILKGAARKALPMVGSALGGYVGGPAGAQIGSRLASGAGRIFGLETEGLTAEDEQFELAKQYVRFAGESVKNAIATPGGDPRVVARAAVNQAAQRHAPGLLRGVAPPTQTAGVTVAQGIGRGRTGRWVRRGNRIILYGV